jgi:hypothetical protein
LTLTLPDSSISQYYPLLLFLKDQSGSPTITGSLLSPHSQPFSLSPTRPIVQLNSAIKSGFRLTARGSSLDSSVTFSGFSIPSNCNRVFVSNRIGDRFVISKDSDQSDIAFNSIGNDKICFFNPNSFGANVKVSYRLQFDGSGLELCNREGCSSKLTNGTHLLPGYYVFDAAAVSNFRRMEIEITGRSQSSEIVGRHWELKRRAMKKVEVIGEKIGNARVLEDVASAPFTQVLRFERGRGQIVRLGLFMWLMTIWWE